MSKWTKQELTRLGQIGGAIGIGIAMTFSACTKKAESQQAMQEPAEPVAEVAVEEPSHHYAVRDGNEYGYARALSTNDQEAGQSAATVVMVRFAGARNGKYQVQASNGTVVTAFECSNPCQVIKLLTAVDGLPGANIEHLQFTPDSIAGGAIDDAINGRLERYVDTDASGANAQRWVEEKRGIVFIKTAS